MPAQEKRIGLIVPSSNTVMEPDFYHNLPSGWTLHTARMFLKDVNAREEAKMLDEYTLPAARDLETIQPDVVIFGCTSAGALRGNEYEKELIKKISETSRAPAISVNKSVRETLRLLNAKHLVVVTPYLDELNVRIKASLENEGMQVLHIQGLGILENTNIAKVSRQKIIKLAQDAVEGKQPDALFVSCTNFPAVDVLPELRSMFPFPVVSSNQAVLDRTIEAVRKQS